MPTQCSRCTFLVPLAQAGVVIFARRGMLLFVNIRDVQLSGAAVRRIDMQRDMCVASRSVNYDATSSTAPMGTSGIRNLGSMN